MTALVSALFSEGASGAGYNLVEPDTWYLDQAMTQPVTESGQRIAAIADVSGNGFHAIQPEGQGPTARQTATGWELEFDGATDYLTIGNAGDFLFPQVYFCTGLVPDFAGSGDRTDAGWGLYLPQSEGSAAFDYATYIGNGATGRLVTTAGGADRGAWTDLAPGQPYLLDLDVMAGTTTMNGQTTAFTPFNIGFGTAYAPLRFGVRGDNVQYYQGSLFSLVIMDRTPPAGALENYKAYLSERVGIQTT